jgi:hypothetical protein
MAHANRNGDAGKIGFFKRLWQGFHQISQAADLTEASVLEERVAEVERRLRDAERGAQASTRSRS